MKKLLYTLLVAATVLGIGGTAFAISGPPTTTVAPVPWTDVAGHQAEPELTLMAALGVFTGSSGLGGAVKPDDPITRAEFCKVLVLAIGKGSTAAGLAGLQPTFTDGASIPTWAWGFVNVAAYMGIINGYADGSFGASLPVTYAEAVTMLIRAVPGHAAQVPPGVWPYNYMFYGVDTGFTGPVDVGFASLPCTRGDMARLLFATMQVDRLKSDGTVLADTAILVEGENLFTGTCYDTWYPNFIGINDYLGLPMKDGVFFVGAAKFDDLLNSPVIAVTDADGKVVWVYKTEGDVITGIFDKLLHDDAGNWFVVLEDGTKVPWANDGPFSWIPVRLNGVDEDEEYLLPGDEVVVNVYDDGFVSSILATRWDLVNWDHGYDGETHTFWSVYGWDYIDAVTKSTTEDDTVVSMYEHSPFDYWCTICWDMDSLDGADVYIPDTAKVTINGATASRDDLKPGDLIKVATVDAYGYDGDAHAIYAVAATRQVAEGTITASRSVFPGDIKYVTLKSGDTSKEYRLGEYAYEPLSWTGNHLFLVGEDGRLFFDAEYETGYPIVIVRGYTVETGTETDYYFDVDNAGDARRYELDGDYSGWVGYAAVLVIDGASGLVENVLEPDDLGMAEVVAIGPDNVTVEWDHGGYAFLETTLAYSEPDNSDDSLADAVFIGLPGLHVGDHVLVLGDDTGGTQQWLLIRDDTPTG